MKIKNFKTAKDLFAKTYNRKIYDFMDFGEISRMKKVTQVRQTQQKEGNKKWLWIVFGFIQLCFLLWLEYYIGLINNNKERKVKC